MKTDYKALARRAVACPRWRWMGGMLVIRPPRHDGATGYCIRLEQDGYRATQDEFPDLSDPATIGCLLALVREAYDQRGFTLSAVKYARSWSVGYMQDAEFCHLRTMVSYLTEAEALVETLEAAP